MSEQPEPRKPLASFAVGPYSIALWENEFDNGDGTQRVAKSVTLRKVYFDRKENVLKDQKISMNQAELGAIKLLISEMEQTVIERRGDGASPF